MMTLDEVIKELKHRGTPQNVKVYRRHGAGDNVFGVSFAHLNHLKRKIWIDHELALQLWDTGNADARSLATMIADPERMTATIANRWVGDVSYYLLADLLAALIARTSFAAAKMDQWMKSKKEYVRQCGYAVLASVLKHGNGVTDTQGRQYLKTIEKEVHTSPNRARHTMNTALIAIGIYLPALTDEAIAAAQRIGPVTVDHGETSCQTPDAVVYIRKALERTRK
ncbi:MAG TPA: DNA alkylation repair protein [Acidobacteriota bacterium]|nr:DNA alkylation repair protein [Acidobacteriota bacterium]